MVPPPLLRRLRFSILLLLVAVLATVWRVRAVQSAPPAPEASHAARSIPFSDVRPFGANFFLDHEVEAWKKKQTVEMAAEAGLGWAKQHFPWSDIEPSPGVYSWRKYDEMVNLYRDHGIQVIARLDWPPAWVEPAAWVRPEDRGKVNAPPADAEAFGRFVAETVRHFSGRVRFFQIWNEPNLLAEWGANEEHPVDPAEYARLLAVASRAARAVDPNVVILSAPLAINLELVNQRGNSSDLTYLDGLYAAGAAPDFDILSANAFGMDRPPEDAPGAAVLNFRRIELQRAIMERHGDSDKAVWFNEYGWNAAPPTVASPWQQVSEAEQADWTVAGVAWANAHWPWAGAFCNWYFRQWGQRTPDMADYYFGMVDVTFRPRPVYGAVRAAGAALAEAVPGDWAELSSPVRLADLDTWRWHWADGADDRNALTALDPGALATFRFHGSSVAMRVRSPAAGAAVRFAIDQPGVDVRTEGELLRLPQSAGEWTWVTLADGLPNRSHTLVLSEASAAGSALSIDGFRVAAPAGQPPLDLTLTALGLAMLGLVGLVVVDGRRAAGRIQL
jgi:hypothetical protein